MSQKAAEKKEEAKPVAWGYEGCDVDPCKWHEHFPAAKGNRQSPVAIATIEVKKDTSVKPLNIKYDSHMCTGLINNGHTFCIGVKSEECNLTGGPLSDKHRLLQFHVHWGADDSKGAEHTVDGVRYAAELHLVHWNSDKFESAAEAIKNDGGIAVLTVFLKVGKKHSDWSKLLGHFKEIEEVDHESCLEEDFNPISLLPENVKDYWTYEGSLTTPPCYESVRFIIFKEPTELSKEQLAQFRLLSVRPGSVKAKGDAPCKLVDNFRPLQPLNGRVVHSSF